MPVMSIVPKSGEGTITFKMDNESSRVGQAKLGPINCRNGFTVEVELVKGWDNDNDW